MTGWDLEHGRAPIQSSQMCKICIYIINFNIDNIDNRFVMTDLPLRALLTTMLTVLRARVQTLARIVNLDMLVEVVYVACVLREPTLTATWVSLV